MKAILQLLAGILLACSIGLIGLDLVGIVVSENDQREVVSSPTVTMQNRRLPNVGPGHITPSASSTSDGEVVPSANLKPSSGAEQGR
ncbi:MAG: hypothetical protein R3282_03520 [Rhodothermales bacterium]|nr:hypothetical protein [Rhodothermales bacterium]